MNALVAGEAKVKPTLQKAVGVSQGFGRPQPAEAEGQQGSDLLATLRWRHRGGWNLCEFVHGWRSRLSNRMRTILNHR